jgi:hypothetical protein
MAFVTNKERCVNRIEWLNLYSYTSLNKVVKNMDTLTLEASIKYLEDVNRAVYELKREIIRLHNIRE